jgi:phenylacetate-CoA ligase
MPTVHLDVLNPDNQGYGEIAITELNSRSVPFIKYKNGDMGKKLEQKCTCKSRYEQIEIHDGRSNDMIVCPNGKKVYAAILAYILKKYAVQFKAYQKRKNLLMIYIIPKSNYTREVENEIKYKIQKYTESDMFIELNVVQNIAFDCAGKHKYFVSQIV